MLGPHYYSLGLVYSEINPFILIMVTKILNIIIYLFVSSKNEITKITLKNIVISLSNDQLIN